MPFQSEKQRRYLWANEPEIARDWTDTYGSGIAKALGGRIPLAKGNFLTGQHFGEEGNRQQLINAMEAGLINERDYKLMSGYDARKEMGITPVQTLQSSGIYNTAKGIMSPEDFEGKIGPIQSTFLNALGSTGYGFNKDQYEGILGLDPEAFNTSETGPYGSNYSAQLAQSSGLAPAYDFDEPSGEIMKVPRNTMAANWSELDDAEAQNIDAQRQMELARLSGMEQYPTEDEDEEGNWLTPQRIGRTALSYLGNKAGLGMGLGMITGPLGWAGAGLAGLGNRLRGGVSQNAFEQARNVRRIQSRIDSMKQRREDDKDYSKTNLANLLKQLGQKDDWSPKPKPSPRPYSPPARPHGGNGGGNQGGGGGQAAADAAGGSSMSSPFNRGGLAWLR